jgi:ABC-type transport system involved in cytochrome c biogenesis permease subunit
MWIPLIVLAALIALFAVALLVSRALGLQLAWLARTRHALAEARLRLQGVLAEFGDWLRLGH